MYPCLIPKFMCKTPIHIEIEPEGLNEYGDPPDSIEIDTKCNYQDKAKTIYTKEKKAVKVTGNAYISGDIAPELPTIPGGTVKIFGVERRIISGTKARNPDETVNYTLLELE